MFPGESATRPRKNDDDARVDRKPPILGQTGRDASDPRERRDSDRLKTVGVACNRGVVVDVSTRGMRLKSWRRWKEGQRRLITLYDPTTRVTLEGKCVWVRKVSPFRSLVGICFEHPIPEQERALANLVQTHNGAVGMIRLVGKTIADAA